MSEVKAPLSLSAIREQLAGISTRGPWEERVNDYGERPSVWKDQEYAFPIGMCVREDCQAEAVYEAGDAAFIAAAPSTVARLLGIVERVEGIAERLAKSNQCEDREIAEDLRAALAGEGA